MPRFVRLGEPPGELSMFDREGRPISFKLPYVTEDAEEIRLLGGAGCVIEEVAPPVELTATVKGKKIDEGGDS